ncbi:MAG: twin-arginine translocation signal domain-containing protein [Candidatus Nanohalobium sp.]
MGSQSEEDIEKLIEKKLDEKLRERKTEEKAEKPGEDGKVSRRKFLKMLGLGAGGLALSSAATGVKWSVLQPQSSGTSDVEAETATQGVTNGNSFEITNSGNTLFSITGGTPGTATLNTDLDLNTPT